MIGSVAEGRARDASDSDVVVVLRAGEPRRSDYGWWETHVVPGLDEEPDRRFPLQPVITGRASLATDEPHLRAALAGGIPLWDPEHVGETLEENASRLPAGVQSHLSRWARISRHLRKDRELAFYRSEDVTPSSFYSRADAEEAKAMAEEILATTEPWIR